MKMRNATKEERASFIFRDNFVELEKYNKDIFFDFEEILSNRCKRFKSHISDYSKLLINNVLEEMKELYKTAPSDAVRFYIVCDIKQLLFAAYKLTQKDYQDLMDYLRIRVNGFTPQKISSIPKLVSTAYIFKGSELKYKNDLYPKDCAVLMRRFQDRNLLTNKFL